SDRRKTLIVVSETVGGPERQRGLEYLPTLDTIVRSANRANVAVYPFDPGGPRAEPAENGALRRLAAEATGAPIVAAVQGRPRRGARAGVLSAVVSRRASRRWKISRPAGAREAPGRRPADAEGVLDRIAGRSAPRGPACKGQRAEAAAAARAGAARQPAGASM